MYNNADNKSASHYTAPLENTPPTHSILELHSEATAKYSKDTNPERDLLQLQEHFQQLQECLNQLGSTANPPMHVEKLAHFSYKLQQLAIILQPCPTSRPVVEPLHSNRQTSPCLFFKTLLHLMDGTSQRRLGQWYRDYSWHLKGESCMPGQGQSMQLTLHTHSWGTSSLEVLEWH